MIPQVNPLLRQVGSKFARLPEDIIFLVMAQLNQKTQASLILTCRHLHNLLEVYLYRRITPAYARSDHQNECLFRTLADRQDLLPYILTYHGPPIPRPVVVVSAPRKRRFLDRFKAPRESNPYTLPINETERFNRAVNIFTKATNIIDLQFTNCCDWISDPRFQLIMQAVARMPLRRLSMWNCNCLQQVLRDQPELEELRLGWRPTLLGTLVETDVPKLRSLSAGLRHAAYLVPGRPIEQLKLHTPFSSLNFDEQLFDKLALSTKPITEFDGTFVRSCDDEIVRTVFRAIARNLPNVEKLTLTLRGSVSGPIVCFLLDIIDSTSFSKITYLHRFSMRYPRSSSSRAWPSSRLHWLQLRTMPAPLVDFTMARSTN